MKSRLFLLKAKLRLKELTRRYQRPINALPLDDFYQKHWLGTAPRGDYLSARRIPRFFFDPNRAREYARTFKQEFPPAATAARKRADRTLKHRFDLLGSGEVCLGEKIDWHQDFKSGRCWPEVHFSKVAIVDPSDESDVKVPWELSRLQHLTDLGRAFWLTDSNQWLDEFRSLVSDWEERNPIDVGVNWTCSMEVAIRAINIIWGLHFFSAGNRLEEPFARRAIRLLYYHGLHIERNLETIAKGSNTNHLLTNYLGLFYLGVLFPEFDRSYGWRKMAKHGLEEEMMLQVAPDGVDYEGSTSYHRLVEEIFLSAYILGERNDFNFSPTYRDRLSKMLDFSMAITAPSGYAPLTGDNDDGFIVKLATDNPADHRQLVEIGLTALERNVPERFSRSEAQLWYHGPESLKVDPVTYKPKSVLFKSTGYAVIQNKDFHLTFNAGRVGDKTQGGHKHNDLLAVTLEVGGAPYLVDAGTCCYTSNYRMRNHSRSTAAHNTVSIDSEEQNRFFEKRLFYLFDDARPVVDLWVRTDDLVVVSATHDGYLRLADSIRHRRTIWAFLDICSFAVLDEFTGKTSSEHRFETRFHTPLARVSPDDEAVMVLGERASRPIHIGSFSLCSGRLTVKPTAIFPRYGVQETAHLIKYKHRSMLPFRNLTMITETAMPIERIDDLQRAADRFKDRFEEIGVDSLC